MSAVSVSVAMCTYNGERYLREQIDSVLSQSYRPSEIIVCDDGSTDRTPEILERYATRYPELMRVLYNVETLGVERNFEQAITECSGDVIAISDQDDVWHPEKLERQVDALERTDAVLACHNSLLTSPNGSPYRTLWESINPPFKPPQSTNPPGSLDELVTRNVVQGATTLFDAELREHLLPIPEGGEYDHWIALVAALVGGIHWIDDELLRYRQHPDQAVGVVPRRGIARLKSSFGLQYEDQLRQVEKWDVFYDRIASMPADALAAERSTALRRIARREELAKVQLRLCNSRTSRSQKTFSYVTTMIRGHYGNLSSGWRFALRDGMMCLL